MSRIGKLPINLPNNTEVSVDDKNVVTVKGPKGSLTTLVYAVIVVKTDDNHVIVERPTEQSVI
jgi:large subunit ribosomal protein L6